MTDRTFGPYPGLAIVGGGSFAGLYGVSGDLHDSQGTGLQHGFAGDYRHDLIHTATTLLRLPGGTVIYGSRTDDGLTHPIRRKPAAEFNRNGYAWGNLFTEPVHRTEVVCASAPGVISFACTVTGPFTGDVMALVVFRGFPGAACRRLSGGQVHWEGPEGKRLALTVEGEAPLLTLVADSPSGFLYRTVQTLQTGAPTPTALACGQPIGVALGRPVSLRHGEQATFRWHIGLADAEPGDPTAFWEGWYREGITLPAPHGDPGLSPESATLEQFYRANLAAIRGAELGGTVPADMSGQYFSQGLPSCYARDALMIARAFLLSGHYRECRSIITRLAGRAVKRGGEFFQRYDAAGEPAEGQDNGVPHQLDSQGYFVRLVVEYHRRTGEWLVPFERLAAALDVLADCVGPQGMVGPEGGVNEGVYGPAYITSSNMFIYGGLLAGIAAARSLGQAEAAQRWEHLAEGIHRGIEAAWDETNGRYCYGFVTYDDQPVRQYDTPQYFGPLFGFPVTERFYRNDRFLRRHATFFGQGIGYSEQEYHHGPWIFNTAACAQFQALAGNWDQYRAMLSWLMAHANQYGQMPEAIDAGDERKAFVNPLVWGCAETVAAIACPPGPPGPPGPPCPPGLPSPPCSPEMPVGGSGRE